MSLRITVIANSIARKNVFKIVSQIEEMSPLNTHIETAFTTAPRTATILTAENVQSTDIFVAVGGDGTVREVAAGLYGTGIPLAIVPAGSTNIIAREHHIPNSTEHAIRLLFSKHDIQSRDAGICNGHPFLHMAGMGFDSFMFAHTNSELKRRIGWAAYLPAAGRALLRGAQHYEIKSDDLAIECKSPLILVANGRSIISPRIEVHPAIESNDGWLDLFVFDASTPIPLIRTVARFVGQSLSKSPFVAHHRVKNVSINAREPVPVEADGDILTSSPARFEINPSAIQIITPVQM